MEIVNNNKEKDRFGNLKIISFTNNLFILDKSFYR